jgi:dienelactone hydrolase
VTHEVAGASRVVFPSNDGDLTHGKPTQLSGWIFRPAGPGIFPAVIALHSCGGLFAPSGDLSARHRDWAERLVKLGYVVFFPDSFSPRHIEEQCNVNPDPLRSLHERTRDAYGALVYLQHQPYVRLEAISLLGWSQGGMDLLAAIDTHSRARPVGLVEDFHSAIAFYPDCQAVLASKKWTPRVPLHILIGKADDWTSSVDCSELVQHAKAHKAKADIVVYPDAFHDFDAPDMPVHQRHVASTSSGMATVGTNPAARAAAIERVTELLKGPDKTVSPE